MTNEISELKRLFDRTTKLLRKHGKSEVASDGSRTVSIKTILPGTDIQVVSGKFNSHSPFEILEGSGVRMERGQTVGGTIKAGITITMGTEEDALALFAKVAKMCPEPEKMVPERKPVIAPYGHYARR